MSALLDMEDDVRYMINMGFSLQDVSDHFEATFGKRRGFSSRNIKKICSERHIHRYAYAAMDRLELENYTYSAVMTLGPCYGRKMVTGYLRSLGINIGERLSGQMLKGLTPIYSAERQTGTDRHINPVPYFAEYAGLKLHMDQNEKLNGFGVTHVIACDGYSSKIMASSTMPVKNNVVIYDEVYHRACNDYGLFDTLRVDFGKEFYLCLYQQENLEQYRTNTNRAPYIQTQSKQNHAVERLWVEVNCRVNYPIKRSLLLMEESGLINMEDDMVRFCVSQFCIQVSRIALENVKSAWNYHTIPGKGVPDCLFMGNCRTSGISPDLLPPGEVVCNQYEADVGILTHYPEFGKDPLCVYREASEQRDIIFSRSYPTLEPITYRLLNRDDSQFQQALLHLIDITDRLA